MGNFGTGRFGRRFYLRGSKAPPITTRCDSNPRFGLGNRHRLSYAGCSARIKADTFMAENTLTITDNRTTKTYTVPVENGTIRAMDLRQIKTGADDFGLMTYDPAYMNTASCKSAITYIDGEKGILRYRGYPIEVLAERCTFLEVAYLLMFGQLPTEKELKAWVYDITHHTMLHETTKKFMEGFRYSAHPMSMFVSTIAALSSVYPDAKFVRDPKHRMHQIIRLIGKVPSIAAML